MAEKPAVWGIDIGQSAIKALKLRYQEQAGQVMAVAFDYVSYPKLLSQPDAVPEEIVPQAMATFLSRNQLKGDLLAMSVAGQSALARFIQLPPVEQSKLGEIIKYEARQQIPFALEDVIWDYQPLGAGVQESGYLLDAEVGLFAMKRDQVRNAMRPFDQQKLELELIQIAPLALYNMLGFDELGIRQETAIEAREDYYIVLDMGCDNTTLLVTNGAKIWLRNVPIAGNHFTRALTKEMKLSFAKAEHLKCNATKAPDPRAVFQALRPVFNDFVSEIQRSIGFFSSVNRQAKITKVIGLGNGFKLAGLQKFLQQNLQYEVDRPDIFKALAGDSVVNAPLFADNILSFAVPYGLALQGLGLTRIHTTLLPPEIRRARIIRQKKPWAAATAAAVLLGGSVATVGNAFCYTAVHTKEFEDAEKKADEFGKKTAAGKTSYDAQVKHFAEADEKLKKYISGRRNLDWIEVYDAINACIPRDEGDPQDADGQDEIDLSKRKQISIYQITSERYGDLKQWFDKLSTDGKESMLAADKSKPPSGKGYVFTVKGVTWFQPKDSQQIDYVNESFLENLKKFTVKVEGHEFDVARMGISHACNPDHFSGTGLLTAPTKAESGAARINLGTRGRRPMGPDTSMPNIAAGTAATGEVKTVPQTTFTIQFVYVLKLMKDRVATDPRDPGKTDAKTDAKK